MRALEFAIGFVGGLLAYALTGYNNWLLALVIAVLSGLVFFAIGDIARNV